MIKSAAGAGSYLVAEANRRADLGVVRGGDRRCRTRRQDPRLLFRRVMFNMARRHGEQVLHRRDSREHVGLS
jgi:hypothetical protein